MKTFLVPIVTVISVVASITLLTTGYDVEVSSKEAYGNGLNDLVTSVTKVVSYDSITTYDSDMPINVTRVEQEGINGLVYVNELGEEIILEPTVSEEIIVGTGKVGEYTGIMTGYGPDCSTCDGRGYTFCDTSDPGWYNIITDGIYYNDEEFGEVRVLAAETDEFPCGTIVKVTSSNAGTFMGIVLDTGYDMRKNFSNGIIHFDVAYTTEKDPEIYKITNKVSVSYSVQRWGF